MSLPAVPLISGDGGGGGGGGEVEGAFRRECIEAIGEANGLHIHEKVAAVAACKGVVTRKPPLVARDRVPR